MGLSLYIFQILAGELFSRPNEFTVKILLKYINTRIQFSFHFIKIETNTVVVNEFQRNDTNILKTNFIILGMN